jgi:dolichol-phosphate mannosyltransferase
LSRMKKKPKVVVIVPTYNEADNIRPLVKALAKVKRSLTSYSFQVLVVDDNSPDGTAKLVTKLASKYSFLKLFRNKHKKGLGAAYKKGMRYAIDKLGAEIVFEFDADLSHDPTKIPQFLTKIAQGADLVLGSRYRQGGGIPPDWPPHRKLLSVLGNLFMRLIMLNFRVTDWTTGYRAITRKVVNKIVPRLQHSAFNGYTWQIGFLVKSIQAGYRIDDVPFQFVDRTEGYSKLGPEYIINTMAYVLKTRLQQLLGHRLFKFAMVGGTGALIQLIFLQIYRGLMPFQLAFFLAIETAIVSNFTLSNLWTFADRQLKASQIPGKFVAFNLASGGSILIQQVIAVVGERFIGLFLLFTLPVINFAVDTGTMYAVTGILVGMFWNFFAYSKLIWRKKK